MAKNVAYDEGDDIDRLQMDFYFDYSNDYEMNFYSIWEDNWIFDIQAPATSST